MATHHLASGLASLGRHGDTMLVHMQPREVAGLQQLAQANGTSLTINPATGMPEAFSLGGLFSSFLPMLAGMAFAPETGGFSMAPLLAGAATGAGLAAAKGDNPLMGGLMGGLGGYSGGQLGPELAAAQPGGWAAGQVVKGAADPLMDTTVNTTLSGAQNSMMTNPLVANAANNINAAGMGAGSGVGFMDKGVQNIMNAGKGLGNIATGQPGAWDAFKAAGGTGTQLAVTGGGLALGGVEPSDIYGDPIDMSEAKKKQAYDPNRSLNLNFDTGLKLYAGGGAVNNPSPAAGGMHDLYGSSDNATGGPLSQDGYGVGRLNSLANAESMNTAKQLGYAGGGAIAFADGGDTLGLGSLDPSTNPDNAASSPSAGIASLPGSAALPTAQNAISNAGKLVDTTITADPKNKTVTLDIQSKEMKPADINTQANTSGPKDASSFYTLPGQPGQQGQTQDQSGQSGLPSLTAGQAPAPSQPIQPQFSPTQAAAPIDYSQMSTPYMAKGGYLDGQGDGMSDSIPATIEGKQPARLADGEFVVPADVVSHIGNGSSKAGSQRLYAMLNKIRKARTGSVKQGKQINPNKFLPA